MIKLISKTAIAAALLVPVAAFADDFDITMDVVGADESFDEVIVNRIALPFAGSANRDALQLQQNSDFAAELVDGVVDVVDGQLSSSDVADDMALDSALDSQVPELREFIVLD